MRRHHLSWAGLPPATVLTVCHNCASQVSVVTNVKKSMSLSLFELCKNPERWFLGKKRVEGGAQSLNFLHSHWLICGRKWPFMDHWFTSMYQAYLRSILQCFCISVTPPHIHFTSRSALLMMILQLYLMLSDCITKRNSRKIQRGGGPPRAFHFYSGMWSPRWVKYISGAYSDYF